MAAEMEEMRRMESTFVEVITAAEAGARGGRRAS